MVNTQKHQWAKHAQIYPGLHSIVATEEVNLCHNLS